MLFKCIELEKVHQDLGFHFNSMLPFSEHYFYILNIASFMLSFINRDCKGFTKPIALKT